MFRDPQATVDEVVAFLGLDPWRLSAAPAWNQAPDLAEPVPGEARLRAWFEPHNRRLSDFLGRDMTW